MTAYGYAFANLLASTIFMWFAAYFLTNNALAAAALSLTVGCGIFALMWTIRGNRDHRTSSNPYHQGQRRD